MRKILSILFFMVIGILLGCPTEELECFPSLRIEFMSTSEIDSIHFYLNDKKNCFERAIIVDGMCNNCSKARGGFFFEHTICRTSEGTEYVSLSRDENDVDNCIKSEKSFIWVYYDCNVNGKNFKNIEDSLTLNLHIFSKGAEATIQPEVTLLSGNRYNVMAVQDTTKWYSNTIDSIEYYSNNYNSAIRWQKIGCNDGFCVAKLSTPIGEQEDCYDK